MATIHDYARMCSNQKCEDCPFSYGDLLTLTCRDILCDHPDRATEIIDEWIAEHPIRTYASNFFEKFPNAPKDKDGVPAELCLIQIYGGECPYDDLYEENICKKCWERKYES